MTALDKAILKNIAIIIISGHHFTFHCQHLKQRKQFKLFSGRGSVFSEIYFKISVYTNNIPWLFYIPNQTWKVFFKKAWKQTLQIPSFPVQFVFLFGECINCAAILTDI